MAKVKIEFEIETSNPIEEAVVRQFVRSVEFTFPGIQWMKDAVEGKKGPFIQNIVLQLVKLKS